MPYKFIRKFIQILVDIYKTNDLNIIREKKNDSYNVS